MLAFRIGEAGKPIGQRVRDERSHTMPYKFNQFYIPDRMMGGITRYIEHGIKPGDFLTAVISNNLTDACGLADEENLENLRAFVGYFYNEAPHDCWGSPEKMKDWVAEFKEKRAEDSPGA